MKTGEKTAIKNIDLNSGEKKIHLLMEIQVMRELVHKNLVAFTDIFLSERYEKIKISGQSWPVVCQHF